MSASAAANPGWQIVCDGFQQFVRTFQKSSAANVNSKSLKEGIKDVIQNYFRQARPELVGLGFTNDELSALDAPFQELLRLSNGNNSKRSYARWVKEIRAALPEISGKRELLLGATQARNAAVQHSPLEAQIMRMLADMIPSAAASYQQALADLSDSNRISFRGAAAELREALREILDHLAPDSAVTRAEGFKLEHGRQNPTMRQKVHFILKARGRTKTAMASPEDATGTVERGVGELARSVYNQGSLATHIAGSRREVIQLKRYVDVVLSDILEI